jgi:hypothetical protein
MQGRSALVSSTDIPGLFDLDVDDGRHLTDITVGQLRFLAQAGVRLVYGAGMAEMPSPPL